MILFQHYGLHLCQRQGSWAESGLDLPSKRNWLINREANILVQSVPVYEAGSTCAVRTPPPARFLPWNSMWREKINKQKRKTPSQDPNGCFSIPETAQGPQRNLCQSKDTGKGEVHRQERWRPRVIYDCWEIQGSLFLGHIKYPLQAAKGGRQEYCLNILVRFALHFSPVHSI